MHITIVDHTFENLMSYREILKEEFRVELIQDPFELLNFLKKNQTDLVLIDTQMPSLNGFDLYKRLQSQRPETPVVFLSGDPSEESIVQGLSLGAHDYIVKPISPKELVARIKNRIYLLPSLQDKEKVIKVGTLTIYCQDEVVDIDGKTVLFTPNEFKILKFLCRNKDRVFSKDEICQRLWNYDKKPCSRIETHISNLRKKLGSSRSHLKTIKSVGYVIKSTY